MGQNEGLATIISLCPNISPRKGINYSILVNGTVRVTTQQELKTKKGVQEKLATGLSGGGTRDTSSPA